MIYSAVGLGITIDLGRNVPGQALQRLTGDYWEFVLNDSEQVLSPVDIESLPAGKYRLLDK